MTNYLEDYHAVVILLFIYDNNHSTYYAVELIQTLLSISTVLLLMNNDHVLLKEQVFVALVPVKAFVRPDMWGAALQLTQPAVLVSCLELLKM